jgi:hypothetical protein
MILADAHLCDRVPCCDVLPFSIRTQARFFAPRNFHRCEGIEATRLIGTYQIEWFFCHENARISRVFLAGWDLAGEKHTACVFIAISFVTNYAFWVLSGPNILLAGSSAARGAVT